MFGLRKTIDALAATEAVERQRKGVVLLDVRDHAEWAAGHAPRALHVPLDDVCRAAHELVGLRVMTVCRTGSRSASAARALAQAGVDVINIAGGMASWARAGLPVVRDDGTPGFVA